MTKILIAGIGGVGGYFGGLLAKKYSESTSIEINFLARGRNLDKISADGLKIIKKDNEWIARPHMVTNDPGDLDKMDFILLCIKSYDLEQTLEQINNCISDSTVIIPLLNGVDSKEKIEKIYPGNLVTHGCAYIISRLTEPGTIVNTGTKDIIYFGLDQIHDQRLIHFHRLLLDADIKNVLTTTITTTIWEKYIFIVAVATATSYFDEVIGKIMETTEKSDLVYDIIDETTTLAIAKNITLPEDVIKITYKKILDIPYQATSSMHSDFISGKAQTEIHSLTGYVVNESKKLSLKAPVLEKMYTKLLEKMK